MADEQHVTFGPCCFCGQAIRKAGADPCSVSVATATGGVQVWSCHGACFRERLTADPELQWLFEPSFF